MTDFHTHLLPGIDDGSDSVATSLAMLDFWQTQGIRRICCTPHFYAGSNTPECFLRQRQKAFYQLRKAYDERDRQGAAADEWDRVHWQTAEEKDGRRSDRPQLLLGAEVHYFDGISSSADLPDLCLDGTKLLLLEMPFRKWTDRMIDEVIQISARGLQPVAAHIERYLDFNSARMIRCFMEETGVLIQCNAGFFLNRKTSRKALHMLKKGQIHFLGSDAHNTDSRQPNLGPALELIGKKLGQEPLDRLEQISEDWLGPEGRESRPFVRFLDQI